MTANNDTNEPTIPIVRWIDLFTPALLQGTAWPFGRLAVNFFTHLEINGKENLVAAQKISKEHGIGVIFAMNHTHELDFLFPLVAVPPTSKLFPMFYVAHGRSVYSDNQGLGWRRYVYALPIFLKSWGAHPYIANQKDYTKSMPYHEELLKIGKTVCIFPEGKIKKNDGEKKTHGGVAYLSETTNAFVVPISVSNAKGMKMSDFLKRKRYITISYGVPISPEKLLDATIPVPERYKKGAEKIMLIIEKNNKNQITSY